jgi:hypothetical protein
MIVTLRNASAQKLARIRALMKHYSRMTFSEQEKETRNEIMDFLEQEAKNISNKTVVLQTDLVPVEKWVTLQIFSDNKYQPIPWPVEILQVPEEQQISLQNNTTNIVYGLSPETVKEIPAGKYTLRAQLIPALSQAIYDELVSKPITFTIAKDDQGDQEMRSIRTLITGEYYTKKKYLVKAEEYVQNLLTWEPNNVSGLMLMGRIKEGLNKDREAFLSYQQAMLALQEIGATEYPPSLIEKINKFVFGYKKKE